MLFYLALPWVRYQSACLSFKIYLGWDMFSRLLPASVDPVWTVSFVCFVSHLRCVLLQKEKSSQAPALCQGLCLFWTPRMAVRPGVSRAPCAGRDGTIHQLLIRSVKKELSVHGRYDRLFMLPVCLECHSSVSLLQTGHILLNKIMSHQPFPGEG